MPRTKDSDRILWLLSENGLMSNLQIKSKLDLANDRYEKIRSELLNEGYIQKYQCRGGGIKITRRGERFISDNETASAVEKEKDLYIPFTELLRTECDENEENAIICNTSALKKRGKWSNPDVVKISSREYRILGQRSLAVITYEIKQANKWNKSCIFEAASHAEFSHESYVVLEWAKDEPIDVDDLMQACGRFGVGLITMRPHYNKFQYDIHQEAIKRNPSLDSIEEYLDYIFERLPDKYTEYETMMKGKRKE